MRTRRLGLKSERRLVAAVMVGYAALGAWAATLTPLLPDEAIYGVLGRRVLQNPQVLFSATGTNSALGALPIAAALPLFDVPLAIRLPTVLAGALCLLFVYLILGEFRPRAEPALGALFFGLHPVLFEAHRTGSFISFSIMLGLASAWKGLVWSRSGRVSELAVCAFLAGLALSVKNISANMIIAGALGLILFARPASARLLRLQWAAACGAFFAGSAFFWSAVTRLPSGLLHSAFLGEPSPWGSAYLSAFALRARHFTDLLLHGSIGYCAGPRGLDPLAPLAVASLGFIAWRSDAARLRRGWIILAFSALASPFTLTTLKPHHLAPVLAGLVVMIWATLCEAAAAAPPRVGRRLQGAALLLSAWFALTVLPAHLLEDRYEADLSRGAGGATYRARDLAGYLSSRGLQNFDLLPSSQTWAHSAILRWESDLAIPAHFHFARSTDYKALAGRIRSGRVWLLPQAAPDQVRRWWLSVAASRGLRPVVLARFYGLRAEPTLDVVRLTERQGRGRR